MLDSFEAALGVPANQDPESHLSAGLIEEGRGVLCKRPDRLSLLKGCVLAALLVWR